MEFDHTNLLIHITKRDDDDDDDHTPQKSKKDCKYEYDSTKCLNSSSSHQTQMLRKSFLIGASLITALFLICLLLMLFKRLRTRSQNPQSRPTPRPTPDSIRLDQDHAPLPLEMDHHIWYINTIGLPHSVIDSIAVYKYKSNDSLIESTDCSVCLSEFQDGDQLRLLPKCSHAFHVPCIDTWLAAHKNCPLCRAPIVCENDTTEAVSEGNDDDDAVSVVVEEAGSSGERGGGQLGMRRSASMDMIVVADDRRLKRLNRAVRSLSCSTRFFSSRHTRIQSSIIPF